MSANRPELVWQGEPERESFVLPDGRSAFIETRPCLVRCMIAPVDLEILEALLGCINREPVLFANHIALPETLLVCSAELRRLSTRGTPVSVALRLRWMATRGVCEDGEERHTGWNRIFRWQTGRWEPTIPPIYDHAEDYANDGLAVLWGG